MSRSLAAFIVAGIVLAAFAPGPAATAQSGTCTVHGSAGVSGGHPHFRAAPGTVVTVAVAAKSLQWQTVVDAVGGYNVSVPKGATGVDAGDTLRANFTADRHEGISSRTLSAPCGTDVLMPTPVFTNLAPVPGPSIAPAGPLDADNLVPSITFSDPESDAILSWSTAWERRTGEDEYVLESGLTRSGSGDPPTAATVLASMTQLGEYWRLSFGLQDEHGTFAERAAVVRIAAPGDLPALSIVEPVSGTSFGTGTVTLRFTDGPSSNGMWTNVDRACRLDEGAYTPCSTNLVFNGLTDGAHTIGVRVTNSGNYTAEASVPFTVDLTDPIITFLEQTPVANAAGWNRGDVTLSWSCSDTRSGVVAPTVTAVVTAEGSAVNGTGTCQDQVGRTASNTVTIKNDRTPPGIGAPLVSPSANAAGWHRASASVSWTCTDSLSGPAAPAPSQSVSEEGSHATSQSCSDAAGNIASALGPTVRIDRTKPATSAQVTGPRLNSSSAWFTGPTTVTLSAADPTSGGVASGIAFTLYAIGTGSQATYSAPFSVSAEGAIDVSYYSLDQAGNDESDPTTTVRIDSTPPTVSLLSPTPGQVLGTDDVSVQFTSSDGNDSLARSGVVRTECATDGSGAFAPCSAGAVLSFTTRGDHSIQVRALDGAGHVGSPQSVSFTIDPSVPSAVIQTPSGAAFLRLRSVQLNFTESPGGTSPIVARNCRMDAQPFAPCTTGDTFTFASDGPHTLTVRLTNEVGRQGFALVAFTVDTVPPSLDVSAPAPGEFLSTRSPIVTFSSDGTGSSIAVRECRIDTGAFAPCASGTALPIDGEGPHSITVRVTDQAGWRASATRDVTVDTAAPILAVTSPVEGAFVNTTTVTFSFTTDGTGSNIVILECRLDGSAFAPCASGASRTLGPEGPHAFTVRAVDQAGNAGTALRSLTLDVTPPTIRVDASRTANVAGWYNGPVTFTSFGSDGLSGVAACDPAATQTAETASTSLKFSCADRAGNTASLTRVVKLDMTPPSGLSSAPARPTDAGGWYNRSIAFAFNGTDALSGILTCSTPVYPGPDTPGTSITGTCTDIAGNAATATTPTFKFDGTGPTATLTAPAWVSATGGTVIHGAADPTSGIKTKRVEFRSNGGPWATLAGSSVPSSRSDGSAFQFRVVAEDNASNARIPSTPDGTTRVDTVAPPPPGGLLASAVSGGDFRLRWAAPSDGGGSPISMYRVEARPAGGTFVPIKTLAGTELLWDQNATNGQVHEFRVAAEDAAGNRGAFTEIASATADASPPNPPTGLVLLGTQAAGFFTAPRLELSWRASAGAADYQILADGVPSGVTSRTNATLSVPVEGAHAVVVVARDAAGNEARSSPLEFRLDLQPPSVSLRAPRAVADPIVRLEYTASDAVTSVAGLVLYQSTDGGPYVPKTLSRADSIINVSVELDHDYGFALVATDLVGHSSPLPAPADAVRVQARPRVVVPPPTPEREIEATTEGAAEIPDETRVAAIHFDDGEDSHLESLIVRFESPTQQVTLVVDDNASAPNVAVTEAVESTVYSYVNVSFTRNEQDAIGGWFRFAVNRSWVDAHEGPSTVFLYRFHEGAWQRLATNMTGSDALDYRFEAYTPGFSTFAIVATQSAGPEERPDLAPASFIAGGLAISLLALLAFFMLRRRTAPASPGTVSAAAAPRVPPVPAARRTVRAAPPKAPARATAAKKGRPRPAVNAPRSV